MGGAVSDERAQRADHLRAVLIEGFPPSRGQAADAQRQSIDERPFNRHVPGCLELAYAHREVASRQTSLPQQNRKPALSGT